MGKNKIQLLDKIDDTFNMKPIYESNYNKKINKNEERVFFTGKFLMYDKANLNNRVYPNEGIMKPAVETYQEIIKNNRAISEISHPDYLHLNLKEASHIITELYDGGDNYYYGKAKTLDTPMGRLLNGILKDVNIGVSARGNGDVMESNGYNKVIEYELNAIDVVYDPSIGQLLNNTLTESRLNSCGIITDSQNKYLKENLDAIVRNTNVVTIRKKDFMKLVNDIIAMAKNNYDVLK